MIDQLIEKITELKNPVCMGLDTRFDYIPLSFLSSGNGDMEFAASQILKYNKALIDAVADIIPCVKIQAACYELYGYLGMEAFAQTIEYARQAGLYTIADVKRNDIGSTAEEYAKAYLGETALLSGRKRAFCPDFITLNAYLGSDGIEPFLKACEEYGRGVFILIKNSNPSSGELQDLVLADGQRVFQRMADLVTDWGEDFIGANGYSEIGGVVGATYPEQMESIRKKHPSLFMLIPGYGAQGGSAKNLLPCFDKNGLGGIINNSRAILTAYRNPKYEGKDFAEAARAALIDMREDILNVFHENGISYK